MSVTFPINIGRLHNIDGSDPDDIQSMIHLLACSDAIDIGELVSSQVWMDDPNKTAKMRSNMTLIFVNPARYPLFLSDFCTIPTNFSIIFAQ